MASVARGRGIGRGRGFGLPKASKPGETQTADQQTKSSNGTAANEFDLTKVLDDLKEDTLSEEVEKITRYISESNTPTRIKEVVDNLTQRTIKNSEFAPLAAKIANKLCSDESYGSAFRADLLKNTQENYKKRESIREKSRSAWMGLVGLICEFFNHLRTGGAPLKPLAGAVHQTLSELLREDAQAGAGNEEDMDEIDCFYENFRTVGQLLESVNQEKADDLMTKIRDMILADNTTSKTRCLLLELLELRACQWKVDPNVMRYYSDTLADIMAKES